MGAGGTPADDQNCADRKRGMHVILWITAQSTAHALRSANPLTGAVKPYKIGSRPKWISATDILPRCSVIFKTKRATLLLTSKKWRLQREGKQSRRHSINIQSDWLFDKPRSYHWLRVASSNLASQPNVSCRSHAVPLQPTMRFTETFGPLSCA